MLLPYFPDKRLRISPCKNIFALVLNTLSSSLDVVLSHLTTFPQGDTTPETLRCFFLRVGSTLWCQLQDMFQLIVTPQGIEKVMIQLIDTPAKVYAIGARLFLSKVPPEVLQNWVLIQLIVTPRLILWKSTGSNKRCVPINGTVSSNWNQRVKLFACRR